MIADIIPKVAEMTNEDDKPFYPRPSSAGPDRCIRQMVYHGLNIKKEPLAGRAIIIFSDSSFHEDLTADWIRKTAYQIHSEQMRVKCRTPMSEGSIDGILTDLTGKDIHYEHKAINHFTYQKYCNGELPMDYLTQCSVYIDALQRNDNPELKEGILLIKNKNTAQYMEFQHEYNLFEDKLTVHQAITSTGDIIKLNIELPNIVQNACDKFNQVLDYIDKKTLPKRQYHINDDWQCSYCQWGKTCWDGYENEFNELQTDTDLPNELADMVRYYKELGAQKKDIESEYDDLKQKVKDLMISVNARQGRAGEYFIKLSLVKQRRIDKELLTPAEILRSTKESFYEKLTVKNLNKKDKDNANV